MARLWVLAGLLLAAPVVSGSADCPSLPPGASAARAAVINWGLTQTLLALDIDPVAVANVRGYRKWVANPVLPGASVDIGRRLEPNLTVLAATRPDVIFMSSFYDGLRRELTRIAPVATFDIYKPGGMPLERARDVAHCLAQRFNRGGALKRLERRLQDAIAGLADSVRAGGKRPSVYVVQFRDADHVRVYGDNSLFGGVLDRAGMANASRQSTNFWGFSTIEFTRLDRLASHLIVVGPVPREAAVMMERSPIWRALPAVREGRVHRLDPVWAYGGLPAATRFAELAATALHGGS